MGESGYKNFEADKWYGLEAPAGKPMVIVVKLNVQIDHLGVCRVKIRLTNEGAIAILTTPEAFGKHIVSKIARWKPVIRSGRKVRQ